MDRNSWKLNHRASFTIRRHVIKVWSVRVSLLGEPFMEHDKPTVSLHLARSWPVSLSKSVNIKYPHQTNVECGLCFAITYRYLLTSVLRKISKDVDYDN